MENTGMHNTIYIGQLPRTELNFAIQAARELGFTVPATYDAGEYTGVTEKNLSITVTHGNFGVLLSHPKGEDPSTFWDRFFSIKESYVPGKEIK